MSLSEKPLNWTDATTRARELRAKVEALATETTLPDEEVIAHPAFDELAFEVSDDPEPEFEATPLDTSDLALPLEPFDESAFEPAPSLTEIHLEEISELPAPPEPPSSLGLPVLPLPPVPPVFATLSSDETPPDPMDTIDTVDTVDSFLAPLGIAEVAADEEAAELPSETELAELVEANSMPAAPVALPPTDQPLAVEADSDDSLSPLPPPPPPPPPATPAVADDVSSLSPLPPPPPAPPAAPDLNAEVAAPAAPLFGSAPPAEPPAAPLFGSAPPAQTSAEPPAAPLFGSAPPAQIPAEPPVEPAPGLGLFSDSSSSVGFPEPPADIAPPSPIAPSADAFDMPLPPPPPALVAEPQLAAPPAWDTPIATPAPADNPTRPGLFTQEPPLDATLSAFDAPFPTTLEPSQTYSLQPAEPAPFPSVEAPAADTGAWLSATTATPAEAAAIPPASDADSVALFGRPTPTAAFGEQPAATGNTSWPSADWPSADVAQPQAPAAVADSVSSDMTDWPATALNSADPMLATAPQVPVPAPPSSMDPGSPFAEGTMDESASTDSGSGQKSFFKRLLGRKDQEPADPNVVSCAACDVPARVDIDNPSLGVRHLSCPKCEKMWTEAASSTEPAH